MPSSAAQLSMRDKFLQEIDTELESLEEARTRIDELQELRAQLTGTPRRGRTTSTPTPSTSGGSSRARHGGRMEQFIQMVHDRPGITIPEAATEMDVQANYLYRVRDRAKGDGKVRVEGQRIFPVSDETADEPVAEAV